MRLVAYVRVSTEEQAASGAGLEAQRDAIEAWCVAMGHEVVSWHVDAGSSAATLERPYLTEALARVMVGHGYEDGEPADGLVVFALDRLTRSVRDFAALLERFARADRALLSVRDSLDTSSPGGRLVGTIFAAVAQWEREVISERTKAALAVKRAQGVRLGAPEKLSGVQRRNVVKLKAAGVSVPDIATRSGVSVATVYRVLSAEGATV